MATAVMACFYCNVDSTPLLIFFLTLIGSLVLGTVFLGVGFLLKGQFRASEDTKFDVFRAEERE